MARRIRRLTINFRDFTDTNPTDTSVTMTMTGPDQAIAANTEPIRQILPITITEEVASGSVTYELIPTNQMINGERYRVSWPGITGITFSMPDADTTLADILRTTPVTPERPFLAPDALADGT